MELQEWFGDPYEYGEEHDAIHLMMAEDEIC